MKFELPPPPLQKIGKHRAARDREKAEVVGAGDENRPLARVVFTVDRSSEMGRQYDEVFSLIELKKRGVENDIGIEINDAIVTLLEEMLEHPRFYGGVQFEDVVAEAELPPIRQRDLIELHRRKELGVERRR